MGQSFIYGKGGGGLKLNGVENSYTVATGETISKGDFVALNSSDEVVHPYNNYLSPDWGTQSFYDITDFETTSQGYEKMVSFTFDNDMAVLVYTPYNTSQINYKLVYMVDGSTTNLTHQTPVVLTTESSSGRDWVKLADGRVLVWYVKSDRYVYYKIFTSTSNSTVSVSSEYQVPTNIQAYAIYDKHTAFTADSNNKIFCAVYNGSTRDAHVLTLNGDNTMTHNYSLSNFSSYSESSFKFKLVEDGKVVGIGSRSGSCGLYLMTYDGSTITKNWETAFTTNGVNAYQMDLRNTSDNLWVIAYVTVDYSTDFIRLRPFTVSGTSITLGTELDAVTTTYGATEFGEIVNLSDNRIMLMHHYQSTTDNYIRWWEVTPSTVTYRGNARVETDNSYRICGTALGVEGNTYKGVFFWWNQAQTDMRFGLVTTDPPAVDYVSVNGVAKENGSGGDTIMVFEPGL